MKPKGGDRRVTRTRRRLKEGLLELIRERSYESVTVQDIIDRADVGRSTFYSHFESKEDLLLDGFDVWLQAPHRPAHGPADSLGPLLAFSGPLLHHVQTQKRFFLGTFFNAANKRVRRKVTGWLVEIIKNDLKRLDADSHAPLEARAQCIAAAFLGLAGWWLESGSDLDATDVNRVFLEAVGVTPRGVSPGP